RSMVESWAMTSEDESSGEAGSNVNVAVEEPRLLHALPGRVRVHLAGWPRERRCAVEARLRQVPGVCSVQANPLTGNVLINFDTTATDEQAILAVLRTPTPDGGAVRGEILSISPGAPHRPRGSAPGGTLRLGHSPDLPYPAATRH